MLLCIPPNNASSLLFGCLSLEFSILCADIPHPFRPLHHVLQILRPTTNPNHVREAHADSHARCARPRLLLCTESSSDDDCPILPTRVRVCLVQCFVAVRLIGARTCCLISVCYRSVGFSSRSIVSASSVDALPVKNRRCSVVKLKFIDGLRKVF